MDGFTKQAHYLAYWRYAFVPPFFPTSEELRQGEHLEFKAPLDFKWLLYHLFYKQTFNNLFSNFEKNHVKLEKKRVKQLFANNFDHKWIFSISNAVKKLCIPDNLLMISLLSNIERGFSFIISNGLVDIYILY